MHQCSVLSLLSKCVSFFHSVFFFFPLCFAGAGLWVGFGGLTPTCTQLHNSLHEWKITAMSPTAPSTHSFDRVVRCLGPILLLVLLRRTSPSRPRPRVPWPFQCKVSFFFPPFIDLFFISAGLSGRFLPTESLGCLNVCSACTGLF